MNFSTIDWPTVLLVGSIGLLVCGILLKVHVKAKAPSSVPERNSIGQYRPRVYH
jgi:hypothetical protein